MSAFNTPYNPQPLAGKVALVTGASSGIGKAAALALAAAGAAVVLGARRADEGEAVAREIRDAGGRASFLKTDVADAAQIQALVDRAVSEFGGLDIAFNNAGTEGDGIVPFAQDSEANLDRIFEINVKGVWRAMRAQIPALQQRGGGSIINNSSVVGRKGGGFFSAYSASKFAVEGLSRSVAAEYADAGIRVNTVAPGPIATEMFGRLDADVTAQFIQGVPAKRAGTPEEVAQAVVYLASDASAFVTGQALGVDGGMLA